MLHEFTAHKLGEVIAFSRIGCEVAGRGGDAFVAALGAQAETFTQDLAELERAATDIADEVALTQAEKTVEKLRTMMEQYIDDAWDDPVELLEWMSFFTGAGTAHWALLSGVAKEQGTDELQTLADTGQRQYHRYLHATSEALQTLGRSRVTSS